MIPDEVLYSFEGLFLELLIVLNVGQPEGGLEYPDVVFIVL